MMKIKYHLEEDLDFLVSPLLSLLVMMENIKTKSVMNDLMIDAKGSDGKPMTAPRQMLGGTCRSGVIKTSYIDAP